MLTQASLDYGIYLIAGTLLLAFLLTRLSSKFGIPGLVLFVAIGMVLGSDISGLIYFDNPFVARLIGMLALIVILFEGGLKTEWSTVRPVLLPAGSLATLGVVGTSLVVGFAAHLVLNISLVEGMLLGAIVGSTDAAAVFSVIGQRRLKPRVKYTLEAESGMNDPMAIFLTILLLSIITAPVASAWDLIGLLVWQAATGLTIGFGMGRGTVTLVNRMRLGDGVLYPALFLTTSLVTYSVVSLVNGSGVLAVYIFAMVIGNSPIPFRHNVIRFHEGLAWLAHVSMFTILGLLVFPRQLIPVIVPGLILAITLILVARPLAVFATTPGMGFTFRERLFVSWAGLRGAVPIILATYPFLVGYEQSNLIFNTVFFVVLTSALLQGTTIPPLARRLGLELGPKRTPVHALELLSLGETNVELVEYRVTEQCAAVNRTLADLPLPEHVVVSAISRGDAMIPPRGSTQLQLGDFLFVLTPSSLVPTVQEILSSGTAGPDVQGSAS